jgi:SAM-dependent methyltransferase
MEHAATSSAMRCSNRQARSSGRSFELIRSFHSRNDGRSSLAEQWAFTKNESSLGWYISPCGNAGSPYRTRVVSNATGRVLEVGIGSGLNLPFYGNKVAEIIGLEPSGRLLGMANEAARRSQIPLRLVEGTAEAIPIENQSVDAVVTTWTMCSIAEIQSALQEMRRVLRPGGRLLFIEHGRAPEPGVRWWQDHLTPAWKHLSGGCHLNRAIEELIENAGFRIERLDKGYMQGPRPMTFMYEGSARPR